MTESDRKIIEQAIESLLEARSTSDSMSKWDRNDAAVTSLRTLLEQKDSVEPVAWLDADLNLRMGKKRYAGPLYAALRRTAHPIRRSTRSLPSLSLRSGSAISADGRSTRDG